MLNGQNATRVGWNLRAETATLAAYGASRAWGVGGELISKRWVTGPNALWPKMLAQKCSP